MPPLPQMPGSMGWSASCLQAPARAPVVRTRQLAAGCTPAAGQQATEAVWARAAFPALWEGRCPLASPRWGPRPLLRLRPLGHRDRSRRWQKRPAQRDHSTHRQWPARDLPWRMTERHQPAPRRDRLRRLGSLRLVEARVLAAARGPAPSLEPVTRGVWSILWLSALSSSLPSLACQAESTSVVQIWARKPPGTQPILMWMWPKTDAASRRLGYVWSEAQSPSGISLHPVPGLAERRPR